MFEVPMRLVAGIEAGALAFVRRRIGIDAVCDLLFFSLVNSASSPLVSFVVRTTPRTSSPQDY